MRALTLADRLAALIGSWPFILWQTAAFALWVCVNVFHVLSFDEYPFVFLNLVLSFQAAYTGPILLMAANRQAEIDRRRAVKNLRTDQDSHEHILRLEQHLDAHFHALRRELSEKIPALSDPSIKASS